MRHAFIADLRCELNFDAGCVYEGLVEMTQRSLGLFARRVPANGEIMRNTSPTAAQVDAPYEPKLAAVSVRTPHDFCVGDRPEFGEVGLEVGILDVLGHILDYETSVHKIQGG